jgi:hypothetical protein
MVWLRLQCAAATVMPLQPGGMEETTLADALRRGNPVVFFDITIAARPAGRIKMELFRDVAPRVRGAGAVVAGVCLTNCFVVLCVLCVPCGRGAPASLLWTQAAENFRYG